MTVPFLYTHVSTPPPAPGEYLTVRVISVQTDLHGLTTYTIEPPRCNIWDGENWKFLASGWRSAEGGKNAV